MHAEQGVPLGPPPLAELNLPPEVEVRLHNQLFERGLYTSQDVRRRLPDVRAALMAALSVDVARILAVFEGAVE